MRRSTRKRQTRLSFDPGQSSSPAAASLSEQVRSKAASVRFTGSGKPKQNIMTQYTSNDRGKRFDPSRSSDSLPPDLPTPISSSQPGHVSEAINLDHSDGADGAPYGPYESPTLPSDNDINTAFDLRTPQSRRPSSPEVVIFTPTPKKRSNSQSRADSRSDATRRKDRRFSAHQTEPASRAILSARQRRMVPDRTDPTTPDGNSSPRRSKRVQINVNKGPKAASKDMFGEAMDVDESQSSASDVQTTVRQTQTPSRMPKADSKASSGQRASARPFILGGRSRNSASPQRRRRSISSTTNKPRLQNTKEKTTGRSSTQLTKETQTGTISAPKSGLAPQKASRKVIQLDSDIDVDEDLEQHVEIGSASPRKRAHNETEPGVSPRTDHPIASSEDSDLAVKSPTKRAKRPGRPSPPQRLGHKPAASQHKKVGKEDVLLTRRNPKDGSRSNVAAVGSSSKFRGARPANGSHHRARDQGSVSPGNPKTARGAKPKRPRAQRENANLKKNERQKLLDILKRRRAGEHVSDSPSSDDDDTSESSRDQDEYESDFVVDDDDTIGAPGGHPNLNLIPLEFTRHAHKKLGEHFTDAVEWMVQNKINPAFARNDELYTTAFRKLNDLALGFTQSKFISSVWVPDFVIALRARPNFRSSYVGAGLASRCEACNRSGHPGTSKVSFEGSPYNRDTLENLSDHEDDNSEGEDNSGKSYDSNDRRVPDTGTEWFLGRTCRKNAKTAHALLHWKYHLNQWVLTWLDEEGYTSPNKVLERNDWNTNKKRKYANDIVDKMEEAGQTMALWQNFKDTVDKARDELSKDTRYARN
ncbi:MAG: hypothetical protein M1837_003379 [Sclerophora amabilis]|nr:MAG: hypothetical protein M1837_003379 [Sclerophora amabilis]